MKKVLLLVLTLFISACDNKPDPVFNKLSQEAIILAFGDSLTYGAGASKGANYPSVLSVLSAHTVINAGISGEISSNGLSRLPALLDKHQPELLVLIHGGNDMLRKIPQQQTSDNLKQMINEAQQRNIKVVMLGVPKFNLFLLSSSEIYQQVAEEYKVPVDLESLSHILSDNALKSDTIHPNDQGYRLMAENIYELLVEAGAL